MSTHTDTISQIGTDVSIDDGTVSPLTPAATPTAAPVRSRRRLTRLAAMALAMLSASTIGVLAQAETTEAAAGVTACFKTRTGMIVGPVTTQLELYYNGTWYSVLAKSNSGFNGCVTYTMTGSYRSYYARVRMNGRASTGDYFYATSPLMALPGDLNVHLGTANVSCIGFCYGV